MHECNGHDVTGSLTLPLRDPRVLQLGHLTRAEHLPPSLGNHGAVVYAEPAADGHHLVTEWGWSDPPPLAMRMATFRPWQTAWLLFPDTLPPSSLADEGYLESRNVAEEDQRTAFFSGMLLTANTPNNEDLLGATVSHGPFSDFHQHSKHCLLYSVVKKGHVKGRGSSQPRTISKMAAPAGRNTSPLPYTDQNSASCETCPVEKRQTCASNSSDRELKRSSYLDIRQYTRK